jgi:hypothetical protein
VKSNIPATLAIVLVAGFASIAACGTSTSGPLDNTKALVILQRQPRLGGIGDVFQYTSYVPGARLVKLEPPTADGTLTQLCCAEFGAEWAQADIQSYDIAFDGRSIVMSARLSSDTPYGLFVLTLDENRNPVGAPSQIATSMEHDYVYPIFAQNDRIIFVANEVVELGAKQHRDEYERGTTTQLGSVAVDGSGAFLGPRNLSHRVAPTMMRDGRVLFTQWDHLGDENSGHLMMVNPDLTALREVFGKEGTGVTNSYLKAVEIEPGRVAVIGTSRDRTLQSGKILDVRLGITDEGGTFRQSEQNSRATDLTPQVPGDREPSQATIGRYYDAYPVSADGAFPDKPFFVVSWADGPVEEETLGAAGLMADFGIYLYDSKAGARRPIFNDPAMWDILARPLGAREAPAVLAPAQPNGISDQGLLIGSLNVYDSSLANARNALTPGSVVKVRVLEGFSVEEGVPDDFGLSEHEGAALLGEADVYEDGSWAAVVPANVPVHLQPIDKFGMALVNEPVWFSGRPGESRFCGGCHEDRSGTTVIQPGITQAVASGPSLMDVPRASRISMTYTRDAVVGVPWDAALQPIFDATIRNGRTVQACSSCHDGDPAKPGNKSLTFTDPETGLTQTFVFDLGPQTVSYGVGDVMLSGYSASHLSLLGPMMGELAEEGIEVTGDLPVYIVPGSARSSMLFQKLNPHQLYPTDTSVRFVPGGPIHPADVGAEPLTEDEYYLLILMSDAGGQFYSRENAPGGY